MTDLVADLWRNARDKSGVLDTASTCLCGSDLKLDVVYSPKHSVRGGREMDISIKKRLFCSNDECIIAVGTYDIARIVALMVAAGAEDPKQTAIKLLRPLRIRDEVARGKRLSQITTTRLRSDGKVSK